MKEINIKQIRINMLLTVTYEALNIQRRRDPRETSKEVRLHLSDLCRGGR